MSYHHGDLRAALIEVATDLIAAHGTAQLSLREVARRAGVSHAAPAHHFGDKLGLLSAVAAEGFTKLASQLREVRERDADDPLAVFLEGGRTYVTFAERHPGHFAVMFRGDLQRLDDEPLRQAAASAYDEMQEITRAVAGPQSLPESAWFAWAFVHGVASLAQEGQWELVAGSKDASALYDKLSGRLLRLFDQP